MKGLEIIKKIKRRPYQPMAQFDIDTIEKELKALEILKQKGIHLEQAISGYVITVDLSKNILTQEQYDLLKEVLKNE